MNTLFTTFNQSSVTFAFLSLNFFAVEFVVLQGIKFCMLSWLFLPLLINPSLNHFSVFSFYLSICLLLSSSETCGSEDAAVLNREDWWNALQFGYCYARRIWQIQGAWTDWVVTCNSGSSWKWWWAHTVICFPLRIWPMVIYTAINGWHNLFSFLSFHWISWVLFCSHVSLLNGKLDSPSWLVSGYQNQQSLLKNRPLPTFSTSLSLPTFSTSLSYRKSIFILHVNWMTYYPTKDETVKYSSCQLYVHPVYDNLA